MDFSKELNSAILDSEIDIDCPVCNKKFSIELNQVGSKVQCPFCKTSIDIT